VVVENQTHQFVLGRVLSPDWTGNIALSYKGGTLKGFSSEAQAALQRDNVTLRRQRRFRDYTSDDLTLQGELTGKFNVGATEHELLVGSEAYRFKIDQLMLRVNPTNAAPYAISVTAPVYGQAQPTPTANTNTNEVQNNLAFYVQDTMKLGERWRVLSGLRHDKASQEVLNRLTSLKTSQSMGATSPKIGLSYLPSKVLTLYANTGKSFRPNTGTNSSSTAFDSEVGYAKEMGLKWESMDKSLGGTFALFDIRKQNVLTTDPANANFQVATGEVRSRGFDADLSGQMNRNWRINTSITVNDATVVRDNSLEVGGRLLNVPRVNGSLLLVYEAMLNDSRYGLGGGVTYTGRRLGQARTQTQVNAGTAAFELPQYTTAKVLAYWRMSPSVRFSLDIDNVFDKTYYTNSFQSTWVGVGAPRTVTLGVQAKF
jgi:iron complex outermembrane receptor protein